MRIQKLGHSCLIVETGDERVLIDPGTLVGDLTDVRGLTGILVTHQHADHYDADRFGSLAEANPDAVIVADEGTAEKITARGLSVRTARAGETPDLHGVSVGVHGTQHELIHADIPVIPNVGYAIDGLFHPGDAFTLPPAGTTVLAAPLVAPWSKVAETVAYLRAAAVATVIPVHDAIAAVPAMYRQIVGGLLPESTTIRGIDGEGLVTF